VQLRLAFHEARSEADKIYGSNLGIKEQEIVIAKLTEHVNAKRFLEGFKGLTARKSLGLLRKADGSVETEHKEPTDGEGMMTDVVDR
jgi:hypothetical protein